MARTAMLEAAGGPIVVEVDDSIALPNNWRASVTDLRSTGPEGYEDVVSHGGPIGDIAKNLGSVKDLIVKVCSEVHGAMEKVQPDSTSVEFGISFAGEGTAFLAKASGEVSLKITLEWKKG